MRTKKQESAARRNLRKAIGAWKDMSHAARKLAQPEGSARRRPGAGGGRCYRIGVRPKSQFRAFRTQDVGRKGHTQRIAGRRASGSWDTVTWLISKDDAHVEGERLVADTAEARKVIEGLASEPHHVSGDRFKAKDRPDVPEGAKPTPAMRRAQRTNIKKAQAALRRRRRPKHA